MNVNRVASQVGLAIPNGVEDVEPGDDAAGPLSQRGEQIELPGRYVDRGIAPPYRAPISVDDEVVYDEPLVVAETPSDDAKPRQELVERERFRQVVVGARVKPVDAIGDRMARCEHQRRDVTSAGAKLAADRRPALARKHPVQDDRVERSGDRGGQPLGPGVADDHLVAGVGQAALEHVGQSFVVFDHQQAHPSIVPTPDADDLASRLLHGPCLPLPRMPELLAVDAVDITKRYGDLIAVDAITLQVAEGEVYGVLGPNGAGKTTFLRMLFGLIRPDSGTIALFGRTREEAGTRSLDGVSGFIESPKFYPYLSGRRNLAGLARLDGGAVPGRMEEVLEIVDLTDRADDKVGGYSFGMRQRLGVAASLLRDPQLLVLDEPANGLDPAGMRDMRALIKRLASSGLTVLLSSHDMSEVEEICDNVTIMSTGSVVYHGQIAELREMAPEQGHRIATNDDRRALELAGAHPGLQVVTSPDDGLIVVGSQAHVDDYVRDLVISGLVLRLLIDTEAPLELLFFMLTESAPEDAQAELDNRPVAAQ